MANRLMIGSPNNPHRGPFKFNEKSATSYYPCATTAWDYINRPMPADKPGSLTPDEVYAVTAFLLFRNGIIQETAALDAKSCRRSRCRIGMALSRQSRCGPRQRSPVGGDRDRLQLLFELSLVGKDVPGALSQCY